MWQFFKNKYLTRFWEPIPSILFIGLLSAYYFGITGSAWAVTGEFTRWGGEILELFGINTKEWEYFKIIGLEGNIFTRKDGVMIIGMFLGALIASLFANNFKIRFPQNKTRILQALIGGAIAGFGARLGMGCNLASFFTGIPQFSLHAWFFTIMSVIGVYVGTKIIKMPFLQSHATLQKGSFEVKKPKNYEKIFFILGVIVFIFSLIYIITLMKNDSFNPLSTLGIATLFGLIFGFVIARAQICFTSAFRDLFLTGRGKIAKAIVVGMLISTLGVFAFIILGIPPKIIWAGPNVIIGGFLFGLGIVIAGGCECGWMYRAMEGQMHYVLVGIGNLIGSVILAYTWPFYSKILATNFPKINLLESFGNYGGLLINYLLLLLFLALIFIIEKNVKNKILKEIA
ncbi:selenium metabolism membrane protein YedE/FdhT [Helicobacter anatolicus]|uniref:selenium metabolism membrane protein YedE/FdhT n=1 Tax=Helicobacter anatolicus TaxID=2905874 RepID=UPI001E2F3DBD|nr:selenium metabolism membrane protein YedE/FdhT [Helicobacter anatolicus]MCE3040340.1 selenium metabolism membrane protein YedE/FdhT [Helicobacter anatolicus]